MQYGQYLFFCCSLYLDSTVPTIASRLSVGLCNINPGLGGGGNKISRNSTFVFTTLIV